MFKQKFILKIKALILIGLFILAGCGQSENNKVNSDIFLTETVEKKDDAKFTETKDKKDNESFEDLLKPPPIPLNTKTEDVHYYKENYVDDILSKPPHCKSDGRNIYLRTNIDFYVMPVGTDEIRPINVEIPEGMDVYDFTFDSYGRMHLFITERDKEEYFLWRLDENYQVDKTIEISSYVDTIEMARWTRWFFVLEDGTYYIQWSLDQEGIIVSSEGILMHEFTLKSLGIGWVRQVAVGRDGHIYIAHGNRDERREIVKLDVNNCLIENTAISFPADELFFAMSGGTDTDLLLFSVYSGVWACDTESGNMENRVSLAETRLGLDKEAEFWIRIFLPDGRLFLLGKADSSDHMLFKYISAGK